MSDYIFLFDLDSTVTREEILPTISKKIGRYDEMRRLTESTMQGEISFLESFLMRVDILKEIRVSDVRSLISQIPLNEHIATFIREHSDRCFIVTGNLDIWISDLMKQIGIENHVYCSRCDVEDDMITKVVSVADKDLICRQFVHPFVAIGDGSNDVPMAKLASISVGFGGVRELAPALSECVDYKFYDDKECAEFLESLL